MHWLSCGTFAEALFARQSTLSEQSGPGRRQLHSREYGSHGSSWQEIHLSFLPLLQPSPRPACARRFVPAVVALSPGAGESPCAAPLPVHPPVQPILPPIQPALPGAFEVAGFSGDKRLLRPAMPPPAKFRHWLQGLPVGLR